MQTLLLIVFVASQLVVSVPVDQDQSPFYCIDSSGRVTPCSSNPSVEFDQNPSTVAHARFVNRINHTGWAELDIESGHRHQDHIQAYFAGFLEGLLTAHLITSYRENVGLGKWGDKEARFCKDLSPFVEDNLNWTLGHLQDAAKDDKDALYWQQVGLVLHQLAGIDDGYLAALNGENPADQNRHPHLRLNPCGSILLNLFAEVGDLEEIINPGSSSVRPLDHCSALVKWLPEKGEVYVSQNTWTMYSMMLRVLKRYNLNYKSSGAKSVALSSYPGAIVSFDDFYITSAELVVQETSIANFRAENYHGLSARNMVFEFVRNTVANRLALSGREWAHWFSHFNSGTYNNQFMVVDYKRTHHDHLEEGFLTVLEQMPHLIWTEDRTEHLRTHTYWASYNIPAFEVIYEYSGTGEQYRKYGDYFSYEKTARARIFARDHSKVTNLTSMYRLMRYNDFQHDPLSACDDICVPKEPNAIYAIAARGDLNDPNAQSPLYQLNQHMLGAIDAKITSQRLARRLEMIAVSGPTEQQEAVFDWTKVPARAQIPHRDQPSVWHFKPVHTRWVKGEEGAEERAEAFEDFQFDL